MLRVIVGTAPGPRSGLWRFWTRADDIYVQGDEMRKELKTSLHASGANHHAWSDSGVARWVPDGDRYMMKWGKPQEFGPGGRRLLGIVLPTDHLMEPDEEPPRSKREKIALLAPAPEGKAIMLSVVVTESGAPAPKGEPSCLLAQWELPARRTLWIVATVDPWDGFRNAVTAARPQMREQLEASIRHTLQPGEHKEGRSVLWTGLNDQGTPHMIEVGVKWGRD